MSVRECEDSSLKGWTNGFREFLARSLPAKESRVEHMTGRWRVMPAWRFLRVSHGKGLPAKYLRNILFGKMSCFVLPSLYPHYIYLHYPQIVRSAFKEKTLENILKSYILERLIVQTFNLHQDLIYRGR